MATKRDVINYVMHTPDNTNPAILSTMLDELGGTSDYSDLKNKPSINGVILNGSLSLEDLGIKAISEKDRETLDKLENRPVERLFHFMGTKELQSFLPTEGNEIGDVWHVNFNNRKFMWNGTEWTSFYGLNGDISGEESDAVDEDFIDDLFA